MRLALVLLALVLGGCGLGAGDEAGEATIVVTRDFGAAAVGERQVEPVREDDSVMRVLERTRAIETAFGGAFVQSIDGVAGSDAKPWSFYVNGIEATKGAADTLLRDGDHVWWDQHAWGEDVRTPAVVGAFPQPFRGRATQLECTAAAAVCDSVRTRLTEAGAKLTDAAGEAVRVRVGTLPETLGDGTFARRERAGLALLDAAGRQTQVLGAGTGLVAATADSGGPPTWHVTGTDEAGVSAAAGALTAERLTGRFALAVAPDGDIPLPAR
jgi:hypothetical protein